MRGPESSASEQGTSSTRSRRDQIDDYDPASIEHPVDSGIRRAPTADLRKNRPRHSNQRPLFVRDGEDRSSSVSEGGPLRSARESIQRFRVENQRSGQADLARARTFFGTDPRSLSISAR